MRTAARLPGAAEGRQWRLLRWGPMAVADLVSECVRDRAAARGGRRRRPARARCSARGPRAADSAAAARGQRVRGASARCGRRGRTGGAGARARARGGPHGVDVRTGAAVRAGAGQRRPRGRRGARLGRDVRGARGGVGRGSEAHLRRCARPSTCRRSSCGASHLRAARHARQGESGPVGAAGRLPARREQMLAGRCGSRPTSISSSAPSTTRSTASARREPWIEFAIPSLPIRRWRRRAPRAVGLRAVGAATMPPGVGSRSRESRWPETASAAAADRAACFDGARRRSSATRPGCARWWSQAELITPADLERDWGLTGGHIFHGELSLDQAFTMRPLLGLELPDADPGLYLCGSGTHPGTGLTGGSGANAARVIVEALT